MFCSEAELEMTRRFDIAVLLLLCSLMSVPALVGSKPTESLVLTLNNCRLGMSQDHCHERLSGWAPINGFRRPDGGTVWLVSPYCYEFSREKTLSKLSCDRSGVLRYGEESINLPASTDRFRKLLGEPDQEVVYSLVEPGDVEHWYYFRLGLVARVYVSPGHTRVVGLTLAPLQGPKPGGRRLVRAKEEMPDPRY